MHAKSKYNLHSVASLNVHFLYSRKFVHLDELFLEFGLHFVPHVDEALLYDLKLILALHD